MIVQRKQQVITSPYGWRWGRKHKGIDLRVYTDDFAVKLSVMLPEDAILERIVFQKKWGYTFVFSPLVSDYKELKFVHMGSNQNLVKKAVYMEGFVIGTTTVTEYMRKKGYSDHLHFETWKDKDLDPVLYLDRLGIDYKFK